MKKYSFLLLFGISPIVILKAQESISRLDRKIQQEGIFQYLTKNTFYLGTSEYEYKKNSIVKFRPELTGTLQMGTLEATFSNSSKTITGSFKVTEDDKVVLEDVTIYDPDSEGSDEMIGLIKKISNSVCKLILKVEGQPSKTFYLIKRN